MGTRNVCFSEPEFRIVEPLVRCSLEDHCIKSAGELAASMWFLNCCRQGVREDVIAASSKIAVNIWPPIHVLAICARFLCTNGINI